MLTGQQLAEAMALIVRPILPDGFWVETNGALLVLQHRAFGPSVTSFDHLDDYDKEDDRYDEQWLAGVVAIGLSNIQDDLALVLREPWPNLDKHAGHRRQPMPDAVVRGNQIVSWFGDAASPYLTLEPIDLL